MRNLPISIILVVLLAACVRPAPLPATPTDIAVQTPFQPPTEIVVPTETATLAPTQTGAATQEASPTAQETEPLASPTESATPQFTPTETLTPTPTEPPFDPEETFGDPYIDERFLSNAHWADKSGALPDTENIRLQLVQGQLWVTGKKLQWDTWWFTWPFLDDFYIQMTVEPDTCGGVDAYGLIFRGPPSGEPAHGYVVAFSCDGSFMARRIDNTSPYDAEELILWSESEHINQGAGERNVLGVLAFGDTISIYANGQKIGEFTDGRYASGRYGVFVSPNQTTNFTYRVLRIKTWQVEELPGITPTVAGTP